MTLPEVPDLTASLSGLSQHVKVLVPRDIEYKVCLYLKILETRNYLIQSR